MEISKTIVMVDCKKIKIYKNNAKRHPKKQIEILAKHIFQVGWDQPIVVDENMEILKGHGRFSAAKKLKLPEVPCIIKTGLSEEQKKAVRIADNKLSSNEYDFDAMKIELDSLMLAGVDAIDLGFSEEELKDVYGLSLDTPDSTKDDEVPDIPQNVLGVKRGDLWLLGAHRLLCGDSTRQDDVERLMAGKKAEMVFTDPPYGISYAGGTKKRNAIENDAIDVLPFYESFLSLGKSISAEGASIYIWHASSETHNCIAAAINSGWLFKSYLIWIKNNSTFGKADYHWQHEPAFYGWASNGTHRWNGDRKQTTTWNIDRPIRSDDHPTMKPVELCEKGIINSSRKDEIVYDPFLGSGSTLIACEKTKRQCFGIEIDPHYCSVIINRWQEYTGQKAVLA